MHFISVFNIIALVFFVGEVYDPIYLYEYRPTLFSLFFDDSNFRAKSSICLWVFDLFSIIDFNRNRFSVRFILFGHLSSSKPFHWFRLLQLKLKRTLRIFRLLFNDCFVVNLFFFPLSFFYFELSDYYPLEKQDKILALSFSFLSILYHTSHCRLVQDIVVQRILFLLICMYVMYGFYSFIQFFSFRLVFHLHYSSLTASCIQSSKWQCIFWNHGIAITLRKNL